MMSDHKLRWGIISTANIGKYAVIPAIQASRNGEVVAVASRDAQKAADFAAGLGIPRSYGSYEELFAAEDIDAVYNPLPNSMHLEWTVKAAGAGKHILCEKPLGLNEAECLGMDAAARENGVKLMEAFMYRFHPRLEKVLQMVRGGALGELRLINAAFTFRLRNPSNIRLNKELGGGSLMDVGCYCVNAARTLAGTEPVEVQALANWASSGVDSQLVGCLRFENGLLAHFDSALDLERRESVIVAGTEGYLEVPASFVPGKGDVEFVEYRGRAEKVVHTLAGVDEYQLMVEHFADCVLNDQPLRYLPAEAAANMRVIEALYRSAHQHGRPVNL